LLSSLRFLTSSCIIPTITPAAAVTGLAKIANATRIISKCGAISAGFDVVFQTINTPNVTKAKNNGPISTIVKNCEPVSVVFVFASSSTILDLASISSASNCIFVTPPSNEVAVGCMAGIIALAKDVLAVDNSNGNGNDE